jgi:hypothetical protein
MVHDRLLSLRARPAIASGVLGLGCGGGLAPAVRIPEGPSDQAKCKVAASHSSPLVTEWPASEKSRLESLTMRGGVVVAYSGCEMRILDGCTVGGTYQYQRTTLSTDTIEIEDEDQLFSKLPLGAASLEGELARSGRLAVRTTVVGQLRLTETRRAKVPAPVRPRDQRRRGRRLQAALRRRDQRGEGGRCSGRRTSGKSSRGDRPCAGRQSRCLRRCAEESAPPVVAPRSGFPVAVEPDRRRPQYAGRTRQEALRRFVRRINRSPTAFASPSLHAILRPLAPRRQWLRSLRVACMGWVPKENKYELKLEAGTA